MGFGRFKRKSIIVSKSVEMVNVTVALFAKFRVNGDVFDILKIGQNRTQYHYLAENSPQFMNKFRCRRVYKARLPKLPKF